MRVLIVGQSETTAELSALFLNRTDFKVGRYASAEGAGNVIDGAEPFLALLHVDGEDFSMLDKLALLLSRGARVMVLAGATSPTLRAAAFDAGAVDVVFPPLTPRRIEAAVLSLLGRPARRETRFASDVSAIVSEHSPGAPAFEARLVDLSRGGTRVYLPAVLAAGSVVRIAMNPPPPHKIPTLFATVLASEPHPDDPGWQIARVRFVGTTDEERSLLTGFVETLSPEPLELPVALEAVLAMDEGALSDADLGTIAGMRLPPFTASERAALAAPAGSKARALARCALARARATMLFEIAEKNPGSDGFIRSRLDAAALRAEAVAAADAAREALGRAVAANDSAATRDLDDGQARLAISADVLERVLAGTGGARESTASLQETSGPVAFDRSKPAASTAAPGAPRVARWARSAFVPVLAIFATAAVFGNIAIRGWLRGERHRDVAREHVAPRTVFSSGPIRVASIFTDRKSSLRVAVVDGSWYQPGVDDHAREKAAREIARHAGIPNGPLLVRDYLARPMAVIDSSGKLTLARIPPPSS